MTISQQLSMSPPSIGRGQPGASGPASGPASGSAPAITRQHQGPAIHPGGQELHRSQMQLPSEAPASSAFGKLPTELIMSVVQALEGRDRLNFALADKVTYDAAQTAFASEHAVREIKKLSINNIDNLNAALEIAEKINISFRHEPMLSIANRLIYLPRENTQADIEAFKKKAKPFISEGNEIDQAIEFFDWSRLAPTTNESDLQPDLFSIRRFSIMFEMRGGRTAREAVKFVEGLHGPVNGHDMDLFVQHARGLEVKGLPDLPDHSILDRQRGIVLKIRGGLTPMKALEFVVDKNTHGLVNSHDMNLFVKYAKVLEVKGLPDLPAHLILSYQRFIKSEMRGGRTAEEAVNFVVKRDGRVNSDQMNFLLQHAHFYAVT